jgi:H+-transporting ATPase
VAGICLGLVDLVFCILGLATGKFVLGLDTATLRTLTVAILVFGGQAIFYMARERRHLWSSRPGRWLLLSSAIDLAIVSTLALNGWLMAPLPREILGGVFAAAVVLAFVLDGCKTVLFRALHVT